MNHSNAVNISLWTNKLPRKGRKTRHIYGCVFPFLKMAVIFGLSFSRLMHGIGKDGNILAVPLESTVSGGMVEANFYAMT